MITLQDLHVVRGGRAVLRGINLTAPLGAVTVVLGPNGSGKSSLLGAVAGNLPYQGKVELAGYDVSRARPETLANLRAVMQQSSDIAFSFRVGEVVALGARGLLPMDETKRRVDRLLDRVGLAGFAGRNARALSGGESQRMQLARVLLQAECAPVQPNWLFLDEPVSSLDLAHQLAVMHLARAHARAGGGVLAVLHDLNLAMMVADQIIVLHEGQIATMGAPDQVMTDEVVASVYGCRVPLCTLPKSGKWMLVQAAG